MPDETHALSVEVIAGFKIIHDWPVDTLGVRGIPERAFAGAGHIRPECSQACVEIIRKIPILVVDIDPAGVNNNRRLNDSFWLSQVANQFFSFEWNGYALQWRIEILGRFQVILDALAVSRLLGRVIEHGKLPDAVVEGRHLIRFHGILGLPLLLKLDASLF